MSLIELEANLDRSETGESNRAVVRRCGSTSWERSASMKFGSIWQRLRSSFANSAGTIVVGMEDDAKTVLIAGPPVPSPPPVAAVPVPPPRCRKRASTSSASSKLAFVPGHPFRRRWEMGFMVLRSYSSVTEDAQHTRSRDCGARPKP